MSFMKIFIRTLKVERDHFMVILILAMQGKEFRELPTIL